MRALGGALAAWCLGKNVSDGGRPARSSRSSGPIRSSAVSSEPPSVARRGARGDAGPPAFLGSETAIKTARSNAAARSIRRRRRVKLERARRETSPGADQPPPSSRRGPPPLPKSPAKDAKRPGGRERRVGARRRRRCAGRCCRRGGRRAPAQRRLALERVAPARTSFTPAPPRDRARGPRSRRTRAVSPPKSRWPLALFAVALAGVGGLVVMLATPLGDAIQERYLKPAPTIAAAVGDVRASVRRAVASAPSPTASSAERRPAGDVELRSRVRAGAGRGA